MVLPIRTHYDALRGACADYAETKRKAGWYAVRSVKGQKTVQVDKVDHFDEGNTTERWFQATIDKSIDFVSVDSYEIERREVQQGYEEKRREVPVGGVRDAMGTILQALNGVKIPYCPGLFWLPGTSVTEWEVYDAVFGRHGSLSYCRPTDMSDQATVDMLTDSLTDYIEKETVRLGSEISNVHKMGEETVEKRKQELAKLYELIRSSSGSMGTAMESLEECVNEVQRSLASAVGKQQADSHFSEMYGVK